MAASGSFANPWTGVRPSSGVAIGRVVRLPMMLNARCGEDAAAPGTGAPREDPQKAANDRSTATVFRGTF